MTTNDDDDADEMMTGDGTQDDLARQTRNPRYSSNAPLLCKEAAGAADSRKGSVATAKASTRTRPHVPLPSREGSLALRAEKGAGCWSCGESFRTRFDVPPRLARGWLALRAEDGASSVCVGGRGGSGGECLLYDRESKPFRPFECLS